MNMLDWLIENIYFIWIVNTFRGGYVFVVKVIAVWTGIMRGANEHLYL